MKTIFSCMCPSAWRDIFEASLEVEMHLTQGLSDLIGTATHSVLNITSYEGNFTCFPHFISQWEEGSE